MLMEFYLSYYHHKAKKITVNMGSLILREKMVCDKNYVEVEILGSGFSYFQKHETTEIKVFLKPQI